MLGLPVRNLLTAEGIRWYCLDMRELYNPVSLSVLMPVILAIGALERSGLYALMKGGINGGIKSFTYRQRTALFSAFVFFLVALVGLILLIFGPHPVLLSVTGYLWTSPFLPGALSVIPWIVILSSLIYAFMSRHLRGRGEWVSVIYWGVLRYGAWVVVILLGASLYRVWCYVLL